MTDLDTRIAALEAELAKPPAFIYNADGTKVPQDRELLSRILAELKAERDAG